MEVLNALYGHQGFEFLHVSKLVGAKTTDVSWADVYKQFNGRIVLSGDCKIAYRPHEAVAFIDNGFCSYFPSKGFGDLRGHEQAATLVHAWPSIAAHAIKSKKAGCWRFHFGGKPDDLRLSPQPMTALEIPSDVLSRTRASRAA